MNDQRRQVKRVKGRCGNSAGKRVPDIAIRQVSGVGKHRLPASGRQAHGQDSAHRDTKRLPTDSFGTCQADRRF